jgi:tRNA-splicing ligase RtcB
MRDGSVIVEGKGNPEFLCCSSHGAGRVMSRQKSKTNVTMKEFQESMIGITAKVDESTKDESPFVYKNFEEVLALQEETIRVLHRIKPIINIKG